MDRAPGLDPAAIEDVVFGNANGAGEDNRNVARMAVLLADLPTSIPGATVNRLCASSLEAAIGASRAVECGDASLVLTGGVESMSRAPWVLAKPEKGFPRGDETLHSTTLGWRLVNPAHARALDYLAGRVRPSDWQTDTRSPARRRTRSPCAATGSRRPRGTAASMTTGSSPCRGPSWRATRASDRIRQSRRWRG